MVEVVNGISGYELTLMPGTTLFGWIRLIVNGKSAGYIYLQDGPIGSHLSFDRSYIVTSVALNLFPTLLDILRQEKNLQIRYFDSESAGSIPSVFIESSATEALSAAELESELSRRKQLLA